MLCVLSSEPALPAEKTDSFDVVVIGGTPGGVAAAVTAARLGHSVALVEYHRHLGGMSSSGLGKSDIEHREMIQGFFKEFVERIKAHYQSDPKNFKLCRDGYFYEPSVAESIFDSFVKEQPSLSLFRHQQIEVVSTSRESQSADRIETVKVSDRDTEEKHVFRAKVFIDATYEGDVYAAAGAEFRLGRESRADFGEPHAGHVYLDWRGKRAMTGTGLGDDRLPAYTYRLCLTTDPQNAASLTAPPPEYNRKNYLGYLDDLNSGRFGKNANLTRIAFSISPIPNQKTDVNMNPRGLGFVFVGENKGYVDISLAERERISTHLRNLTLGLLWFLQNDEEVPANARELARQHQLCRDEFADNDNFPFQLYVREARRLVGEYTLSERNITVQSGITSELVHPDAIAVGEFPVDSFPVEKRQPNDDAVLEGYMCMLSGITRPYQIPYRIMIPKKLDGLIVPVAASTTHVAFSSIRLEPTWMAMGQAAGIAAHLAVSKNLLPRQVPIDELQKLLRQQGAVIDLPENPRR